MRLVVGGANGFVGSHLAKLLASLGHTIIPLQRSRESSSTSTLSWSQLDVRRRAPPALLACDAVINAAGINVLDPLQPFTATRRRACIESRCSTAAILSRALLDLEEVHQLKAPLLIQITGVGALPSHMQYPGSDWQRMERGTKHQNRISGSGFWPDFVKHWEAAVDKKLESVIFLRPGVVLGAGGGVIGNLSFPFRMGLGGPMGSGNQPFPWIHVKDLASSIDFIVGKWKKQELVGKVVHAVSPHLITNLEFSEAFGRALNRPAILPLPSMVVKTIFGSTRAELLLEGPIVAPTELLQMGFKFRYGDINQALKDIVEDV